MDPRQPLVEIGIARLRQKLLDLSNRNPLLNFRHAERSRTHIRVVGAVPDAVFSGLNEGNEFLFRSLPEPEGEPIDELNDEFQQALDEARLTDVKFLADIEGVEEDSPTFARAERALKDRVRIRLGMPPRAGREGMSPAEYARMLGIPTSYELQRSQPHDPAELRASKELQTLLFPEAMERKLSGLRDQTRQALEETGINTLFAAYGFLEWLDPASGKSLISPLLLQPLEIERRAIGGHYRYWISGTGEETEVNLTLVERLAQRDHNVLLPGICDESTPEGYFEAVETLLENKPGWRLHRFLTIGLFSFGRLAMWHDLDPARWPTHTQLAARPVLLDLLGGSERHEVGTAADEYDVDDPELAQLVPPLIAPADSSQLSAIIDALQGRNFALKGPPGTGKSQTITNLIAAALAKGKTVLFVAEKVAALNVVRTRLGSAGLGEFCLELHSAKARKKDVLAALQRRLEIQNNLPAPQAIDHGLTELRSLKEKLRAYADLLNTQVGRIGKTVQEVLWAEQRTREFPLPDGIDQITIADAAQYSAFDLDRVRGALQTLGEIADAAAAEFGGDLTKHPWSILHRSGLSIFEQEDLVRSVARWHALITDCERRLTAATRELGCPAPQTLAAAYHLKSTLAGIPESLSDGVNRGLFLELMSEEARKTLATFLSKLARRDEIQRMLAAKGFDGCSAPDLQEITQTAATLGVGDRRISELPEIVAQIDEQLRLVRAASAIAARVSAALGGSRPFTLESLSSIHMTCVILASVPRRVLSARSAELLDEECEAVIQRGMAECIRLRKVREQLSARFSLGAGLNSLKLRQAAQTLRTAGWLGRLSSSYRSARKLWCGLARGAEAKPIEMAADLGHIADHLDEVNDFLASEQLRRVAGRHFDGIATDFDVLIAVLDFTKTVRSSVKSLEYRRAVLELGVEELSSAILSQSEIDVLARAIDTLAASEAGSLDELETAIDSKLKGVSALRERLVEAQADGSCRLSELSEIAAAIEEARWTSHQLNGMVAANPFVTLAEHNSSEAALTLEAAASLVQTLSKSPEGVPLCKFIFSGDPDARLAVAASHRRQLIEVLEAIEKASEHACSLLGMPQVDFDTQLGTLNSMLLSAVEASEALPAWLQFRHAEAIARREGAGEIVDIYMRSNSTFSTMALAFDRAFYRSLARHAFLACPELAKLSGYDLEKARRRFQELDREIMVLERKRLASQLCRRPIPTGISTGRRSNWTELALVQHQIALQRNHRPIRELLRRAGGAIKAMTPCFMMSPSSVAQFLTPGAIEFDLVVIDEASQMRPEEAIGSLARTRQVVVVGDPLQLPPTSFFDRADTHTDEEVEELGLETESILDMALDVFQPYRDLRWHYRSRHESLIAFSNQRFYEDRLIVFPSPSPHSDDLGVRFHWVGGTYVSKGGNLDEVREIAAAAVDFMNRYPDRSLGIVTLNIAQSELLREEFDRLELRERVVREYRARWQDTLEPFIIKNLENIQGDERDVIFISTVYGPVRSGGPVMQRFGPINGPVGHRRLNVLFTRAKERVEVFSSMRSSDIVLTDTSSAGVQALKAYLEYAETGRLQVSADTGRPPDSDFEIFVAEALMRRGYEVEPQVGVAGFFIDLAVRDPRGRHGYLLGIECDGATYHSAKSVRDRDALRQEILESLGWTIYRIWSTDWFADPRRELDRLVRRIEELSTSAPKNVLESEIIVPDQSKPPRNEIDIGDLVTIAFIDAPDRRIGVRITADRHAPERGWVHARHPFGLALLGNTVGDDVEIETAVGPRVAKILSVEKQ